MLDEHGVFVMSQLLVESFDCMSKLQCIGDTAQYHNKHVVASLYSITILVKTAVKNPLVEFLLAL